VVVATVDDYQGEENKIILLTLVRSNEEGKIGFTGIENRIIVAISRAQHGMFIMGNAEMICKGSPLWARTIQQMDSNGCYGSSLPLTDDRFGKKVIKVNTAEHIAAVLRGEHNLSKKELRKFEMKKREEMQKKAEAGAKSAA